MRFRIIALSAFLASFTLLAFSTEPESIPATYKQISGPFACVTATVEDACTLITASGNVRCTVISGENAFRPITAQSPVGCVVAIYKPLD